jgi:cyclophilin family peptidyl-prolyl cis-trans isomerase
LRRVVEPVTVGAMIRLAALLLVVVFAGCASLPPASTTPAAPGAPGPGAPLADGVYAEITTPRGVLLCELYFEKMPLTVANFVGLAEGKLGPAPRQPYFEGLTFHRVVPGFVVQGGDPTGTGRGGPGYRFPDEFAAGLRHDVPGVLSMANSGPDTNGSQFFITLGEARYLDFVHSIFGRVVRGAELLPQITRGDTMTVKIIRQGRAAQRFQTDEKSFTERLARASRARPPHFADKSGTGSGGEHWQAKYIENRLANLARFTGRHIYVRLLDRFEPEQPGQTLEQYVADLAAKQNLPAGALLACFFSDSDRWLLHGAPAKVKLPAIEPPEAPATQPTTLDAMAQQRQRELYRATGQVVSSLIDQTDPK